MNKTRIKDGSILYHHQRGDFIGDHIEKYRDYFEGNILRRISKKNLFPTGNYIEIGANIGNHIVFYKKHTRAEKIFAFEPLPENFEIAKKNVKENNIKNVTINEFGLGKRDEITTFYINESNYGNSSINPQKDSDNTKKDVCIKNTNDALGNLLKNCSFMKIDIEGAEKFIIKDIISLIKGKEMTMWIELRSQDYTLYEYKEIQKLIGQAGYKLVFNHAYDFVFTSLTHHKSLDLSFENLWLNDEIWKIRDAYDISNNKAEIKILQGKYKSIKSKTKIKFKNKLIWSKLFRFFTLKAFFLEKE